MSKTGRIIFVTLHIILAAFIIFFWGQLSVVSGQSQAGKLSLGIECKTSHTYLADALKQFPSKYPTSRGYVRATVRGWSTSNPVAERGNIYDSKFLMLVTEDGQNLNIQVIGSELDLALRHEIWPLTGKYRSWSPVLEFRGKYNDWVYGWYEIDLMGRFLIEYNDPKNPNKVTGYQNEVYR